MFELDAKPSRFVVHVSADNRYRLFVNGEQVSSGPQRSDLMHWRYETVDLAPHLRAGRNVLAALVWNWGAEKPVAQFSRQTAFLLQGDSPREAVVNSSPEWKVLRNEGYAPIPVQGNAIGGYYASPPGEAIDARRYPWSWTQLDFSEEGWVAAAAGEGFRARRTQLRASNPFGEAGGWQLVARSLPSMEESPVRFAAVRRSEGIEPDEGFIRGTSDLVVPAKTRAVVLLDQQHLTNAFAVLETSGGAGSTVGLVYAEALKDKKGNKGNRNEIEGKTIVGVRDEFRPDGGAHRRFQTLWFRTYRFVQVEIQTGDEALRIHDLHGIFVGYPFKLVARFDSDLAWLADMWEINWRGARLCAWETYFDTPYYEQLQYVGDTRIQALITLYMSGDDRLVRQAIEHFDLSRIPEGITASRYPSDLGQYIPTFSPIWVAMVHDFWMHRDEPEYVRGFLPGIRAVLGWFERRVDETGMVGSISWWPFVDWAQAWGRGVPPGGVEGHSTVISLQFVYALERAAELEKALGVPALADHYRSLARKVRDAVRSRILGCGPWVVPGHAGRQDVQSAGQCDGCAHRRRRACRPGGSDGARALGHDAHAVDLLLQLLPARGAAESRARRALRRAARTLAGHAGDGPDDRARDPGTDALRLARLERAPQLRTPGDRTRRTGLRSRVSRKCASRRILVRCSAPRAACPIPRERSWCGWPGPRAAGFAARSRCRRGSRACWSGAGRKPRCDRAARSCRFDAALGRTSGCGVAMACACHARHHRLLLPRPTRLSPASGARLSSCAELATTFRFAHTTITSAEPVAVRHPDVGW